jgi:hypothetical protein
MQNVKLVCSSCDISKKDDEGSKHTARQTAAKGSWLLEIFHFVDIDTLSYAKVQYSHITSSSSSKKKINWMGTKICLSIWKTVGKSSFYFGKYMMKDFRFCFCTKSFFHVTNWILELFVSLSFSLNQNVLHLNSLCSLNHHNKKLPRVLLLVSYSYLFHLLVFATILVIDLLNEKNINITPQRQ